MEILSPAGTPEGLAAAVKGGCDAVYLAGRSFGARAFAGNFDDRQLEGAVGYAHDRGVKVHVAVNTSIPDREMDEAVSFVRFVEDVGADAVLIQDLGLLRAVSSLDIPKHASTQMQIHSLKGAEWCAENGLSRAVLARELTMDEVSAVARDSPIETEAFIQGALCYCMSGGCLMSSFMGGRSGNRGSCAQPCRRRYTKDGRAGYLLSCADLFGVGYIGRMRDAGVASLKIEGRMRSPAYSYLATRVYSLAEDGDFGEEYEEALALLRTVFNRGASDGYLGGVASPVQPLFPDNRGFRLGRATVRRQRLVRYDFVDPVGERDGLSLFDGDAKVGGFRVSGTDPVTVPFRIPDGEYDVYRTYDPRIDDVKNLIGRAPKLTGRTARRPVSGTLPPRSPRRVADPDRSFYAASMRTVDAVLPYADRIYFEWGPGMEEAREACDAEGAEFAAILPRFDAADECSFDGPVMASNPSQLLTHMGRRIYAAPSFNVFNSMFPADVYQATLSVELSRNEVSELASRYPGRAEVVVFGRPELMYSRDPGMESGALVDEDGASFPVYTDRRGFARILSSADLFLMDEIPEIGGSGAASVGIDVRKRPPALAKAVAEYSRRPDPKLRERIRGMCGGEFTQTLFRRGLRRDLEASGGQR